MLKVQARSRFRVVRASPGHPAMIGCGWRLSAASDRLDSSPCRRRQPRQGSAVGTVLRMSWAPFHVQTTHTLSLSHHHAAEEACGPDCAGRDSTAAVVEELPCQSALVACLRTCECEHCMQRLTLFSAIDILIPYRSRRTSS